MVTRSTHLSAGFLALGLSFAACSGGGGTSNASPRITTIPAQTTTGGTFTLDVADYVSDREGSTVAYAVTSGGGSFAGSVYSNAFDTMGTYTVEFTATDGSKTTNGTFEVQVTAANLVVVKEDNSGLLLLDSTTNAFVRVTGSAPAPTFAAGLGDGRLVYQLGNPKQLWVFDPMTREATRLAENSTGDVTYRAKTSDGKIVYTDGSSNDMAIRYYNPVTGVTHELAQGALSSVTVLVNNADLVFYEIGDGGQADIYYYDPSEDESYPVATSATDEQLYSVLADGGVVFTRVGTGGEHDLYYFRVGTGLVEIGADISALATRDKTLWGYYGSNSEVVFTALNGGDDELYFWKPSTGQTTAIATGIDTEVAGIGAGNEVVYYDVVSATEKDAYFYDLDDGTAATLRDSTDISAVSTITDGGSTRWAIIRGSGATTSILAVSLVSSPSTQTYAAGGNVTANDTLANGDVVATRVDETAINVFDASAGTWGTPITGTGLTFGGDGLDDGDFVYTVTVSSQVDLSMWDASGTASVVLSDTAGDDAFAAKTEDGTILFTRVVGTNTNTDLFVWDGTDETRLTDEDAASLKHDHSVLGKYSGAR
ncbi:MAG: hypothetical protein KDC48_03070 [Planctomycetes bacterium]|nr:hypothetical protein [Planctomycetota bacterium]